jgi:hypothetical protein
MTKRNASVEDRAELSRLRADLHVRKKKKKLDEEIDLQTYHDEAEHE